MGYQVGVTPLQMAAAVSSIANGGMLIEPRVVRAIIKDGRRIEVRAEGAAPHGHRRTTAATLTDDHGSGRRARHRRRRAQIDGYTIAGKTGTAHKLVNGRYSTVGLQRVVRRVRPVAQAGAHDHRRHRLAARRTATTAAPSRRRSSSASPRRRCVTSALRRPSNRAAAGAGRAPRRRRSRAAPQPVDASATLDRRRSSRRRDGRDAGPARPERARSAARR